MLSIRPQCFSPAEKQCRRLRRFANLQRTAQMQPFGNVTYCGRDASFMSAARGTVIEADCQTSSTVCAFKNPRVAEGSFFGSAGRPSVNATSFLRGTAQSSFADATRTSDRLKRTGRKPADAVTAYAEAATL